MIAWLAALILGQAPAAGPLPVEPAAIAKDADLIGREVVVDDRVRFYSSSGKRGPLGQHIFDELTLRRTEIPFRLPPKLRPEHPTAPPAARVTGTVRVDGRMIYVDVSAVEPMPNDLDRLNREVKRLGADDSSGRMKANPVATYRAAPESTRAAIDRALLADALERLLDRRLADDPSRAQALAEEAQAKLPDRPAVAMRLRERALTATEARATAMRLSEVEALAKDFRDAGQPERAKAVVKTWLDDQRKRLNESDVDGHVILASQYDRLLSDREAATELLQAALKADPQSKPVTDAFRRMGFRRSDKGEWYDPDPARATAKADDAPAEAAPSSGKGDTLRGKTPEQVRQNLGKPTRIAREATQDATIEQWTYIQGPRRRLIVVIHRPRGSARAEVVASYSLQ
jgi:tetratricopeptide (TPR) repeat protein